MESEYTERLKRKQKERTEQFRKLQNDFEFNEEQNKIVALSVDQLLEKLKTGNLTSTEVLNAYIAKALESTEKFNSVTEFVPSSLNLAQELDSKESSVPLPLHGLPFCVKDDFNIVEMDSTLGFSKNLYCPASETATLVQVLQDLGAIPFCKTNIPQSLLSFGSENPIFGQTVNCRNVKMSPAGSSSGTGSLVGDGGATFGLGSDIGGSGRVPAHFNGVCSIKPTSNRLSGKGIVQSMPKAVGMIGVPSIFAQRAETVALVFKEITGDPEGRQNLYDPLCLPIPWRNEIFKSTKKLRIGYFTSLSSFPPIGDTEKIVMDAKNTLEFNGHTLISFSFPPSFNLSICETLMFADDGQAFAKSFEDEPVISDCISELVKLIREGTFRTGPKSLVESMFLRKQMIEDVLDAMKKNELDLILSPVFPNPALRLDKPRDHLGGSYVCCWNLLDFPAGVVPFGSESGNNIENFDEKVYPHFKELKEFMPHSIGMPIGVQVIGKPFMEENVLRILMELDDVRKLK